MSRKIDIISHIETLLKELKTLEGGGDVARRGKPAPSPRSVFSGLTAEIFGLVGEGFFKEPKSLSDIQHKLRMEGISKPVTSLQKPLIVLIRNKVLSRNKPIGEAKGHFKYLERRK